uniref:Uncharacterized protein n=1 Tax=Brassica campestris TaxID=3711 RepID=A0A3P6C776_BRACM|nr:unnamed protein product [Brassica rapa]
MRWRRTSADERESLKKNSAPGEGGESVEELRRRARRGGGGRDEIEEEEERTRRRAQDHGSIPVTCFIKMN